MIGSVVLAALGIVIVGQLWTLRLALQRLSVQVATVALALRELQDALERPEDR